MQQVQKTANNQLAQASTYHQHSQKLVNSLIKLDGEDTKSAGKMELMAITSNLMPAGVPMLVETRNYPTIESLVPQLSKKVMIGVLLLMVRDFCGSINVVRNMNEDQMIEAASMMLDECGNFRLEDYLIMFAMAKRGKIGKIMDRVDIQYISGIMDEYWTIRNKAGRNAELDKEAQWKYPQKPVDSMLVVEAFEQVTEMLKSKIKADEEEEHREWSERVEKDKEALRMKISYTPECIALMQQGMTRNEAIEQLLKDKS